MNPAERIGRLRTAVSAAAVASFAAGLGVGALLAGVPRPGENEGPFPDYERRFVKAFDPTADQVLHLRYLLRKVREREEEIRNRFAASAEPQLRTLSADLEASVREDILTPEQRARYEDLLAAAGGGRRP